MITYDLLAAGAPWPLACHCLDLPGLRPDVLLLGTAMTVCERVGRMASHG